MIRERQDIISELYSEWFGKQDEADRTACGHGQNGSTNGNSGVPPLLTDEDITVLLRAEDTGKGARLLDGNVNGYKSPSEADAALAAKVAFYTNDADQIVRILQSSGLSREKHARGDYMRDTAEAALQLVTKKYDPGRRKRPAGGADQARRLATELALQGQAEDDEAWPPPVVKALCQWLRQTYGPKFRRGKLLYSETRGREISQSEISASPTSDVLALLARQQDAPRDRNGNLDTGRLVYHYHTWLPVAWSDVAKDLDDEPDTGEVVEPAREEFISRLSSALLELVPLTYTYAAKDGERNEVQRRPLIEWARMFAKKPRWESVRGYRIWSRNDNGITRIAIRAELFGQLRCDLKRLSQRKLSDLAVLYGVGKPCHVAGGDARAIELSQEYLADLFAEPFDQLTQEAETHAPACEGASVRHGESDQPYAKST